MIFNLVNKYKYLLPVIYGAIGIVLLGVLAVFFCAQINCQNCSLATINPSFFLMPILTYGSIGLVGLTIGFTRKTASEKNALDFDKLMSELNEAFKVIGVVRKKMLLPNSDLDRRKATAYMQELEAAVLAERAKVQASGKVAEKPADERADVAAGSVFFMCSSNSAEAESGGSHNFIYYGMTPSEPKKPAEKPAAIEPTAMEVWAAAGKILNSFEGCANAIRYGIYDEDFIYNVYGSQFINFYELTYGLIKSRQVELPRAWVNFEWLAVKWTLRRKITGVVSKEWEETSYIIQESLAAIKEHTKVRPAPKKLQGFMDKLERRKFPA